MKQIIRMKKETLIPEHSRNVGLFLLRKRKTRDENRNKYRKF